PSQRIVDERKIHLFELVVALAAYLGQRLTRPMYAQKAICMQPVEPCDRRIDLHHPAVGGLRLDRLAEAALRPRQREVIPWIQRTAGNRLLRIAHRLAEAALGDEPPRVIV